MSQLSAHCNTLDTGDAMRKAIIDFSANTSGSAALEYSLVAGAVALGVIAAIVSLGESLGAIYQTIASGIASMNATSP
jgi:Flp pilus assembly pilin Flp